MRLLLLSAASLMALATPAFAQDAEFEGLYVGVSGGFDAQPNDAGEAVAFDRNLDGTFTDAIVTGTGANAFSTGFCNGRARERTRLPAGCAKDRDGYSFSGRVGYDRQYGHIVVGVIAESGDSNIRDSVAAFSITPQSYTLNRTILYTANIRARVGYAANKTLFYATGGGVYARVDNYFRTTNTTNTFTTNGDSNAFGFTAGGGVEQKITDHISFGVEYLFNRLQDDDYRVRVSGGPAGNPFILGNTSGADFRRSYEAFRWHSGRVTLNYRF